MIAAQPQTQPSRKVLGLPKVSKPQSTKGAKGKIAHHAERVGPLTKAEHFKIMYHPHVALLDMIAGRANASDWWTLLFRMKATLIIAECIYSAEVVKYFQRTFLLLVDLEARSNERTEWFLTQDEAETLSAALQQADEVQLATDRATQIYAYKRTQTILSRYNNSLE